MIGRVCFVYLPSSVSLHGLFRSSLHHHINLSVQFVLSCLRSRFSSWVSYLSVWYNSVVRIMFLFVVCVCLFSPLDGS